MPPTNLSRAKDLAFIGYSRVALDQLSFAHQSHRALDGRNVMRLQSIFDLEGCQRSEEQNFVDVMVSRADLDALDEDQVSRELSCDWSSMPTIHHGEVQCLSGRHRIEAAKQHLVPNDRWWIARLFVDNLPESERVRLAEGFANERAHTDGEIFHKIRFYHGRQEADAENKWWARLTETKRKDLRQLLRDERYSRAFDLMLPWPGLWTSMKLGSLHRLLCLKCDEELLQYLRHVAKVWREIVPDSINPHSIDAVTVQKLQALAPSHSTEDAAIIRQLFAEHKVFPKVTLAGDRALLLTNTLSVCGILPSLYTFFEDIKYLEPCAKAMRGLCGGKSTRTIHKSMVGSFFDPADRLIEHSRLEFHPCPAVSPSVYQHLAYVQLWLFALRHFPQLSNTAPRKSRARDKPIVLEPSPAIWHAFAKLAMILGFKTDDIINLRRSDPSNDDHAVEEICSSWEALGNRREAAPDVNFATSLALKTMERCGRPFEVDHYYDQAQLFLPKILEKPTLTGQNITTFYRKWNMLHVFFNLDSVPHISLPVATAAQHVQCESTPSRANHEAALLGSVNDSKSRLERELDLQTKVDRLGEQLKQAERAAAAKESALQAQNERLLALDAQSSKTVLRLQSQNNETCRKIRALETDLSAQQSSHEKQVQSLEEYEARTSKERAEELIRAEAERTRQVNHAKRELQTCRVELQQSRSAFDALNESSETKMTSLKAELEQARKKTAIKEAAFNKQSNQFLAQISQMDASNLRIQDQYDQTCQRVLSLEVELRAEKSAHNDKILCTESSWSKYMRDREEEMREVMARLEEKIDEVNRAKTSLQECQVQCNKFSSMTDTLVTENQALERNLAESAKKILELEELGSEMRAEMERLEGKIPILEQELESAKAKEDDQEQKIYGTEVQLINSQGLHEREMKHKYDELLRLQGVVLRSASNADLVFSGKKLSAGSYITMHIALHTEFGVETWVRYIAEEDALEAVESLGLCTENHRCKFDLAFPPNYDIVTGQLVQEPTRLADVWKREGELWQWSKSIQQPVRSFIDGYKKSLLPRGQKRKSPVEGDVRNRAQRSRRRGKAPLSVIEDGPTRLAIEAPNVDLSSRR